MLQALLTALVLAQAPAFKLIGSAETMPAGKQKAFVLEDDRVVTLELKGPTALVLEVRGDGNPESIQFFVERDDRYKVTSTVELKVTKKNPMKGFALGGRLGLEVPAGVHKITLRGPGKRIAVIPTLMKRLPASLDAAPEVDAGPPAPPATDPAAPAAPPPNSPSTP